MNFALPDLRGRTPIHIGGGHTLGEPGGEQAHTLTISRDADAHASRRHGQRVGVNQFATNGAYLAASTAVYHGPTNLIVAASGDGHHVGGSQAHINMQPFLTLNFCIALQGIFPSQN